MTEGIHEIWEVAGSKAGITARFDLQQRWDLAGNCSELTLGLELQSSQYYQYTYYLNGTVKLAGQTLATFRSATPTHAVQISKKNTWYPVVGWSADDQGSPWTLQQVAHETDGSKSVTLEVSIKGYTSGGSGGSGWGVSFTKEILLDPIPRASTLAATDSAIGSVSLIAVTRHSEAYSHSIAFRFGTLSGYLGETGQVCDTEQRFTAAVVPFRLPDSFYWQIPDSPTGVCRLSCRTYLEDVQIGEVQETGFTVTADPALCGPVLSGTVTDGNPATVALTGDANILVAELSEAVCQVEATAQKGASIVATAVNGGTAGVTVPPVDGIFRFSCRDSRGYSAEYSLQKQVVPYVPLTARLTAQRTDPTGGTVQVQVSGHCFAGSFGVRENTLAIVCRANGEAYPMTARVEGQTYEATAELPGFDYRSSHTFTVTVCDALMSLERTAQVGKGIPVFDWGERDFAFHVPVRAPSFNGFSHLGLAAYPVGAVFGTVTDQNPAVLLGGSWEKVETELTGVYLWQRMEDEQEDTAVLGRGILGLLLLGKE